VPGAVDDARVKIAEKPHADAWLERVAPLTSGFGWLLGLELLATVHWVTTHEGATSENAAIDQTHA